MVLNLAELIRASGFTGVAGQGFVNHVTGSESGSKMTDYRISAISWVGFPDDTITYVNNPQVFQFTATITRGPKAHLIQRNTADAWFAELDSPPPGASVSFTNFVPLGNPLGATHEFDVSVTPAYNGTPAPGVSGSLLPDNTPEFFASIGTFGGGGSSNLTLRLTYDPDNALFNPAITGSWSFDLNNRSFVLSDFEVRWYESASDRSSDTNRLDTANYYNHPVVLNIFESFTAYARFVRLADNAMYDTEATVTRNA